MRKQTLHIIYFLFLIAVASGVNPSYAQNGQSPEKEEESITDMIWNFFFGSESTRVDDQNWGEGDQLASYDDLYQVIDLAGMCKFSIGDQASWKNVDYPDKNWENLRIPEEWERQGFHGYDGYAWYRIKFNGNRLDPKKPYYLMLGYIDDTDETYLNGQLIGQSGMMPPRFRTAYNHIRKYFIPQELINYTGENVLAIRVFDNYKSGGLCGGDLGIYSPVNSKDTQLKQNLAGVWKFKAYGNNTYKEVDHDDSDWKSILVPAYWDNQGYRTLDGIAWYRKRFDLSFKPQADIEYYLVLGKIDDFDETWLNGKLIGETTDGLQLGASQSYNKVRLYHIPKGLLKADSENVLAVKVTDIGIEGGIYTGTVAIVEASQLTAVLNSFK